MLNARAAIFEIKYSFSEGATFALRLMKRDILAGKSRAKSNYFI